MESIKFSIIIPVKSINDYIRETVPHIQALENRNWELIILPNELEPTEWVDKRIKIISSGRVGPAAKRDLGAINAKGDILVFLDDDSYPSPKLLDIAAPYFEDVEIVALGGPAITPFDDGFWQKVSGAVFLSKYSGGNPERYLPIGMAKQVDDWPSVNLMVRRHEFQAIGGFNSPYWPGEDTKLCLDLIEKTNKKIIYVPNMKVWHHRRSGILTHLKQVGAYGLHRGYFAKVYPKTSRKIMYFAPPAFFIFTIASLFIWKYPFEIKVVIGLIWMVYVAVLIKAYSDISAHEKSIVAFCAIFFTIATHQWYGYCFIKGFFTNNLKSRLR
jgi:glycosyltransferase involved in cell wall biosynthesis